MRILSTILTLYWYVILARVLMSWFNPNPHNPIVDAINRLTEPVLAPIRRMLPSMGGFDLSPLIVFFILMFLQNLFR
jgi:YggT family protein|tara:strand:+ start:215 stop:445 length:231 start_codon:yes stop_codon:yes gene_type:complete